MRFVPFDFVFWLSERTGTSSAISWVNYGLAVTQTLVQYNIFLTFQLSLFEAKSFVI